MPGVETFQNRRILVIDDQQSIHDDFAKILRHDSAANDVLANAASDFFGDHDTDSANSRDSFEIDFALQGKEGFELARNAHINGRPYAVAFVDMRMPPGWDGIETIAHIWDACPETQVIICTAYSDYLWEETVARLGRTDRLVILKKPFDNIEVRQLAEALSTKWSLAQQARMKLEDLALLVERRTEELENAKQELLLLNSNLVAAIAAADAANRSKSEFLANMSHEIRTPMTAILGYADVLKSENEISDSTLGREALDTIIRNGHHLLHIVNDILDLSKIEAGRMETEKIRCSAADIVQQVTSLMSARAQEGSISLSIEYKTPVPETIITDPTRLRQILTNIIGNAVKFTSTGFVRVELSAPDPATADTTEQMYIDVIDTGVGLTPEQRTRLFQPFSQGDATTTRKFGGTGLGLVISRRLSELLGGSLTITHTAPQKGTTFRLTVTTGALKGIRNLTSPSESSASGAPSAPPDQRSVQTIDYKILLAEDGPDNQRLIAHVLRKAGATVSVADNGKQALEAVRASVNANAPFDIILMDIQMPEMDGLEATRQIRAGGSTQPIIALTAHAMKDDEDKCRSAGCSAFMSKPIDRTQLVTLIHDMMTNQSGAHA